MFHFRWQDVFLQRDHFIPSLPQNVHNKGHHGRLIDNTLYSCSDWNMQTCLLLIPSLFSPVHSILLPRLPGLLCSDALKSTHWLTCTQPLRRERWRRIAAAPDDLTWPLGVVMAASALFPQHHCAVPLLSNIIYSWNFHFTGLLHA